MLCPWPLPHPSAGLADKGFAVLPQEAHNCSYTCGLHGLAPVTGGDPATATCVMVTRDGPLKDPSYPPNTTLYGGSRACSC